MRISDWSQTCALPIFPGVVDLSDLAADADGIARIMLESVQAMLLKIALQMAHDDYTDRRERKRQGIALAKAAGRSGGRKGERATHARNVALPEADKRNAKTAELDDCDRSHNQR